MAQRTRATAQGSLSPTQVGERAGVRGWRESAETPLTLPSPRKRGEGTFEAIAVTPRTGECFLSNFSAKALRALRLRGEGSF
jgi:hypothetical protein